MGASSDAAYCHFPKSQALDTTWDAKLKVQLHYLQEVWLRAGDLTSLTFLFPLYEWDMSSASGSFGEDCWNECKCFVWCLEHLLHSCCFIPMPCSRVWSSQLCCALSRRYPKAVKTCVSKWGLGREERRACADLFFPSFLPVRVLPAGDS